MHVAKKWNQKATLLISLLNHPIARTTVRKITTFETRKVSLRKIWLSFSRAQKIKICWAKSAHDHTVSFYRLFFVLWAIKNRKRKMGERGCCQMKTLCASQLLALLLGGAPKTFWGFEIFFHWSNLAKLAFYPDKCDKMCDICRKISGIYVHGFFYRVSKCSKICSFLSLDYIFK